MSYDNWLDAPYNVPEPICCECGDDISGEVFVLEDDDGNEHPYCETCYNADREKLYTFSVTVELTIAGTGNNEVEALQNALDDMDIIERGELSASNVIEWEYND